MTQPKREEPEGICEMWGHRVPVRSPRPPDEYPRSPRCGALLLRLLAG